MNIKELSKIMEDQQIELLTNTYDPQQLVPILQQFTQKNDNNFLFPNLCINNRRAVLWTALFQHIQNQCSEAIQPLCLTSLRILSRDKTDLDNILCEKWITILIEKAGLYNFVSQDDMAMINIEMPPKQIAVEALKCLCNIAFNSEFARALCASTSIAHGLVARLRVYKEIPYKDDIILFDMKLLFILTALRPDIKKLIKVELHGMDYLTSCLNELVMEATVFEEEMGACASSITAEDAYNCTLNDSQQAIVCEILKTQFNLIMHTGAEEPSEEDEAMYLKLIPVLTALLHAQCSSFDKVMELHNNIANLLTSVPQVCFSYLSPKLGIGETAQYQYDGRNMDVIQCLLQLLEYKLSITKSTKNQYEMLSPILTVLNKGCRGCRSQRKYLRQVILPPLRDVSRPPEKGNTLRNQLCRFLTTPVTSVRDLVAELLFILCKEKVARFVKYTGFGNAAGHLAQKGLLSGGKSFNYSSSSEDSDTEEYIQAQPNIDPVVGCTRPKPSNPFEGMTEEQKEYEAMKLVNLFDRLVTDGTVKPARIGPDGRPQPVQHVLEFREHAKDIPHS